MGPAFLKLRSKEASALVTLRSSSALSKGSTAGGEALLYLAWVAGAKGKAGKIRLFWRPTCGGPNVLAHLLVVRLEKASDPQGKKGKKGVKPFEPFTFFRR